MDTSNNIFADAVHAHRQGRHADAERAYRAILRENPNHFGALHMLGILAIETGHINPAVELLQHATSVDPNIPEAWNNLGLAYYKCQQFVDAIRSFRRAIELRPTFSEAHCNLGNAFLSHHSPEEAVAAYKRATEVNPDNARAFNNLAAVYVELGDRIAAREALEHALALNPQSGIAACNLEVVNENSSVIEGFLTSAPPQKAAELRFRRAWRLLSRGKFDEGWREYEIRHQLEIYPNKRTYDSPQWRGEPLGEKKIHLHAEQGLGDSIQFIRYAALVKDLSARITVECPRPLIRLFSSMPEIDHIIAEGEDVPANDFHCPLLSLPLAFRTTLETIPCRIPYLQPPPSDVAAFKQAIGTRQGLRVGVCWAGGTLHKRAHERNMPLSLLPRLFAVNDTTFFSLRTGSTSEEKAALSPLKNFVDWTHNLIDLASTAALVVNLDLVITVDTAVAHLAGALGRPTWLLLSSPTDWRWMLKTDASPWYPTMKLFRQASTGWGGQIDKVAVELKQLVSRHSG